MLLFGDVAEVLPELTGTFDAWYLDGFSPDKNPAMWEDRLFPLIAARTGRGGTLATFSSAGRVRRALQAAGFSVALSLRGAIEPLRVSAIVVATPTEQAARLLAPIEPGFSGAFGRIDYAPVVQVGAGYRLRDVSETRVRERGGFGFLVPRGEGLRSLGIVFNSFLFPGRAPESPERMASFTTFLGGATDPAIRGCSDDEIAATAHAEMSRVLGLRGEPLARHIARLDRALPQYNLGHGATVEALGALCSGIPGLFLTGNYLAGPSLGACVEQANKVAEEIARFCSLEERPRL